MERGGLIIMYVRGDGERGTYHHVYEGRREM